MADDMMGAAVSTARDAGKTVTRSGPFAIFSAVMLGVVCFVLYMVLGVQQKNITGVETHVAALWDSHKELKGEIGTGNDMLELNLKSLGQRIDYVERSCRSSVGPRTGQNDYGQELKRLREQLETLRQAR